MKENTLILREQTQLTNTVFKMKLTGLTESLKPGQFVDLRLPELYLRRPISVCDAHDDELTLIYKVVGKGTKVMSTMQEGTSFPSLVNLGNGYDLSKSGDSPLLAGGGVGVPPLYYLAKELLAQGKKVQVILGFNTKDEIFFEQEFINLGCTVYVTTADGSYGIKGFVTDALKQIPSYTYVYACGPMVMLQALDRAITSDAEYSFEERMGCGFGACMGCSKKTKTGYKRVCKDGPVFAKEEIIWED